MILKIVLATLTIAAVIGLARSDDFDLDDDFWTAYFASLIIGNIPNCASGVQSCSDAWPCCQYYGRSEMVCTSGQCIQSVCAAADQPCGLGVGECCYHLGLQCSNFLFGGTCTLPTGRK